jgi:hypothetical protein
LVNSLSTLKLTSGRRTPRCASSHEALAIPCFSPPTKQWCSSHHHTPVNPTAMLLTSTLSRKLRPSPLVTIAIEVNNLNGYSHWSGQLNPQHADEWASMVSNVRDYVNSHRYHEMRVAAAMDIEPSYNDYTTTSSWTKKYKARGTSTYYNFGSTDSYPCDNGTLIPRPALSCAYGGGNGWYVGSFYDVSWKGAQALPELYNPNSNYGVLESRYWYVVKRWSYDHSDSELQFSGASMPGLNPPGSTENWRSFWLQLNSDQNTQQPIVTSTYYAPLTP